MKLTKYKQEISSITKMEDCMGSKIPSLSMIKKEFGEEDTLKAVGKKIKQVNDYFNFKTKMNQQQIFMTAKLIMRDYHWLNMGDMKLIIEGMLTLDYGQYFGKLDGGDFLAAFKTYSGDRMNYSQDRAEQDHHASKNEIVVKGSFTRKIYKDGKDTEVTVNTTKRVENEPKQLDGDKFIEENYE